MAANTAPIFTINPNIMIATISVANTGRDGSGTLVTIGTVGANGTRVDRIVITAQGTTTAGMVRLFIYNGTTNFLWVEVPVTAVTPSGTVQAFTATVTPTNGLVLPSTYLLKAAPNNAETFNVIGFAGDY